MQKYQSNLNRIGLVLIFLFLLTLPGVNVYQIPKIHSANLEEVNSPDPAPYPVNLEKSPLPSLTANGILIIDMPSQITLFEKNKNERFPPASTTKIVTSLVAYDYFQPDQILTVKNPIKEGRLMNLKEGERISAENLVYGTLVHSANDAAFAIADNYPGGLEGFVQKMNEKVQSLGLTNTHFTNPAGFEDQNHYTSAYDLAQISRLALENEKFKKIISTRIISVSDESYSIFHTLENVNILLGKVPGVAGVKTGWTEEAGEVLSTIVKRDNHEILIVLLKSKDRFGETESIINWVFENFVWMDLRPTGSQ